MRAYNGTSWVFNSLVITFQKLSNKDHLQFETSTHFYYDKQFIKKHNAIFKLLSHWMDIALPWQFYTTLKNKADQNSIATLHLGSPHRLICEMPHYFRRQVIFSRNYTINIPSIIGLIDLFIYLPSDLYRYGSSQSHTYSYIKENRSVQNICHNNILQANRNTNNMSKLCYMIHNNL